MASRAAPPTAPDPHSEERLAPQPPHHGFPRRRVSNHEAADGASPFETPAFGALLRVRGESRTRG